MNKIITKRELLIVLLIAFSMITLYAQPGDPGGAPTGGDPVVSTVPLDGGALELLMAGLAIIGFKKIKKWFKEKKYSL
jgi:hypothetical protein